MSDSTTKHLSLEPPNDEHNMVDMLERRHSGNRKLLQSTIKAKFRHMIELENQMKEDIKSCHRMCSDSSRVHSFGHGAAHEISIKNRYATMIQVVNNDIDELLDTLMAQSS